jgi:hypothetical protein
MKLKNFVNKNLIREYLLDKNQELDTLITCSGNDIRCSTTDRALFGALISFENRREIDINRLIKFIEKTDIYPQRLISSVQRRTIRNGKDLKD